MKFTKCSLHECACACLCACECVYVCRNVCMGQVQNIPFSIFLFCPYFLFRSIRFFSQSHFLDVFVPKYVCIASVCACVRVCHLILRSHALQDFRLWLCAFSFPKFVCTIFSNKHGMDGNESVYMFKYHHHRYTAHSTECWTAWRV